MKLVSLVPLSLLALGSVALAEDKTAPTGNMSRDADTSDKMKGSPNADGAQEGATESTSGRRLQLRGQAQEAGPKENRDRTQIRCDPSLLPADRFGL